MKLLSMLLSQVAGPGLVDGCADQVPEMPPQNLARRTDRLEKTETNRKKP